MMSHSATFYGPLNEDGFGANCRLLKTCLKDIDRSKMQVLMNTLSINRLLQKKFQNFHRQYYWISRLTVQFISRM